MIQLGLIVDGFEAVCEGVASNSASFSCCVKEYEGEREGIASNLASNSSKMQVKSILLIVVLNFFVNYILYPLVFSVVCDYHRKLNDLVQV